MNAPLPDEERIRDALISAARTNQSLRRPRFRQLMQYKEQIRELRNQDASFETIEKILRQNSFHASHETIRVFYREVIEQKSTRRKRRRKKQVRNLKPKPVKRTKAWSIGEPRIARIEDL